MVQILHHVQLAMPAGREDEARAFYARFLGIPEKAKPADHVTRGGIWLVSDPLGNRLELIEAADART